MECHKPAPRVSTLHVSLARLPFFGKSAKFRCEWFVLLGSDKWMNESENVTSTPYVLRRRRRWQCLCKININSEFTRCEPLLLHGAACSLQRSTACGEIAHVHCMRMHLRLPSLHHHVALCFRLFCTCKTACHFREVKIDAATKNGQN